MGGGPRRVCHFDPTADTAGAAQAPASQQPAKTPTWWAKCLMMGGDHPSNPVIECSDILGSKPKVLAQAKTRARVACTREKGDGGRLKAGMAKIDSYNLPFVRQSFQQDRSPERLQNVAQRTGVLECYSQQDV
jgi:hypothetical protein